MGSRGLRITLAGACSVVAVDDDSRPLPVPSRQARMVLAHLALSRRPVPGDQLAELLWPETLPASWERHLSAVVSKVRRVLRAAAGTDADVEGRTGSYELKLPDGSVIDVIEARDAIELARSLLSTERLDEALAMAEAAADVARRPLLSGCDSVWVDDQRDELRMLLVRALGIVVDVAVQRRNPAGLEPAREAVSVNPYRETAYRKLIQLHLALGEREAAIEVFERCRAVLGGELGMPASAELEALRRTTFEESAIPGDSPAPSFDNTPRTRGLGLPTPSTSFVGRAQELSTVAEALRTSRLVTLIGTAGVGKSRLALEVAHYVSAEYRDGVDLCELAQVVEPKGVAFALAASAGVRQQQGISIEDSLIDGMRARCRLLVIDNCEHVLDALVPLIERVVAYCSQITVLATSRERLRAGGEAVQDVNPLAVPHEHTDTETVWDRPPPALELLRDRISGARPSFSPDERQRAAVVEIARRLDGLPLALELAATRIATMGPIEIARRLDQRFAVLDRGDRAAPPRHHTLRAAVEWSHELLDDDERRVFEHTSVFPGGFTLETAERVCSQRDLLQVDAVSDSVGALVDKSLLIIDDTGPRTRYRMLETLREFGRHCLSERDELATVEEAHALHFTELAERAEPLLRGPAEAEWVHLLHDEVDNLRAAYSWAQASGKRRITVRLLAALHWYAHWRMWTELSAWADGLTEEDDTLALASRALAAAGHGAWQRGDLTTAKKLGKRAIAAGTDTDARFGWHVLGAAAIFEGRLDAADSAFDHAIVLARRGDDPYHVADLLGSRAVAQGYAGRTASAIATSRESFAEAARSGSPSALAWASYAIGEVLTTTDPDEALAYLDRAVDLADTVSAEFIRGVALLSATSLRSRHGDPATAAHALAEVIDIWDQAGNWRQQWTTLRQAVELFARLGDDEAAAIVLGAIDAGDAVNLYGADAALLAALRADVSAHLGAVAEAALAKGRTMDPVDVVGFTRSRLVASASS